MCGSFVKAVILIVLIALAASCGPAAPTPVPPTHTPLPSVAPPIATATAVSTAPAPSAAPSQAPPAPATPGGGGGQIAFDTSRGGNLEIYVMFLDGSNETNLTNHREGDVNPAWSPDGNKIAFEAYRDGNAEIYVMNADGSDQERLTDHLGEDASPTWSPDGSQIVFYSKRDGNAEIYVMNADGSGQTPLANHPADDSYPVWSPDGNRIAFTTDRDGNDEIYVMDADGGNPVNLTQHEAADWLPAWSPDGTEILFSSERDGNYEIYVMEADGRNPTRLTDDPASDYSPTWTTDGRQILFGSKRGGKADIYVMNADGSDQKRLTHNAFGNYSPDWKPGGTNTAPPTATAVVPTPTATEAPESNPYPALDAQVDPMTYGGQLTDWGYDILLLDDGGTLIVGQVDNTGPSHRITPGKAHVIRTDAAGNATWEKDYGGEVDSMFYCPIQTGEDEYVILGQIAASYTRDEEDIYLVKIDGQGNEIWSHTYGGRGTDIGKMVRQTADGGFILVADRADEFPSGGLYQSDLVLVKTDAEGNELWTRTYGSKILYLGWGVAQTPDGGYILIGWEAKTIPDRDVIAIKTDAAGEVEWSRTWDLDPGDRDGGFDMILTGDGHVVIAGIRSMDSGPRGAVLIKVDLEGNEVWVKDFTEGQGNEFWDIMEDTDGGYVMAGCRYLSPFDPRTGEAVREGLVIKTDPDGEVLWQYILSSSEFESSLLSSAVVLPGRGYIFVGGAMPTGEAYWDALWLKLTTDGTTVPPTDTAGLPTGTNTPTLAAISVDTADQVELLSTLSGHDDKVNDLALSADGAHLASSSLDKTIKLWDVETWQQVHTFRMNKAGFNGIAFSPDGRLLASADAIWDVESRQVVHMLEQGRNDPGPVAFSPDGSLLAVALEGRPIKLWDVASGKVLRTFAEQPDAVTFSIVFSPDGALLAAGVHGGMVRLWDVARGQIVGTLDHGGASDDVHDLAFSPDGRVLASAGNDDTVHLWDVASGQSVHTLRHGDGLYGVAFSPDGRLLAAAGCDRTVKLWDVASGRQMHSLPHADEVMAVAFSPDGTLLVSGGYDHQIYLWGVSR